MMDRRTLHSAEACKKLLKKCEWRYSVEAYKILYSWRTWRFFTECNEDITKLDISASLK